jgi:hypothetical protein
LTARGIKKTLGSGHGLAGGFSIGLALPTIA